MIRVASAQEMSSFTEFEEEIVFDEDDPDFDVHPINVPIFYQVSSNMSLASVHPAELHSSHSSLTTLSHSLDDLNDCNWSPQLHSEHVLTIEELRMQLSSCFTCGVSWIEDHVSLDCSECGGYAMERPCAKCDGSCGAVWKRDLAKSHSSGRARWMGECNNVPLDNSSSSATAKEPITPNTPAPPATTAQNAIITQELCNRLEKLNANNS